MSTFGNQSRLQKFHFGAVVQRRQQTKEGFFDAQRMDRRDFTRETERWWLFDAAGMQMREVAQITAHYLTGQHRPDFTPSVLTPDQVVVINVKDTVMVGDNWMREPVTWETPWPSGRYRVRAAEMFERDPCMLLHNYVRKELVHYHSGARRLHQGLMRSRALMEFAWLYEDAIHPHGDQAPRPIRWEGQKKGMTYKGSFQRKWWVNPYLK
jgi:large subunit ribosomal protein L13